jgi:cytochrome c oxidase cbb3-type subunit III
MKRMLFAVGMLVVAGASRASAQAADGKAVYEENCRKCHGVIGNPPKTMKEKYPKIATFDAKFITERSDDSVKKILNKGKGEDMKSFKGKLTDDEIEAVTKYVRELGEKHKA